MPIQGGSKTWGHFQTNLYSSALCQLANDNKLVLYVAVYFDTHCVSPWLCVPSGVGTNFGVGDRRDEARRAESGSGVLGEGQLASSPPARGYGERGQGRSPDRRRVFLYSAPSDCLSQHFSTCCIQFASLGIRGVRIDICEIWLIINTLVKLDCR